MTPKVGDTFRSHFMTSLSPSSPAERGDMQKQLEGFLGTIKKPYDEKFAEVMKTHSPITPEQAAPIAIGLGAAASTGLVLSAAGSTLGEILSLGQVEQHSEWLRSIVMVVGLGTIAGATIRVPYRWAVDIPYNYWAAKQFTPYIPDMRYLFDGRSRFILWQEEFERLIRYHGYNPEGKLEKPREWYLEEDLLDTTKSPREWRREKIDTYGKLFRRLAEAPAGYFLLSMASRSGFFDEKVFLEALRESDYGPLAMRIAMEAFKRAFLRRWLTKFEDDVIEDYLNGEISAEEFKERLKNLGYSDDVVHIFYGFFSERKARKLKGTSLTIARTRFIEGVDSEEEFKLKLAALRYSPEAIEDFVEVAKADKEAKRILTKGDVLGLYSAAIIKKEEAKRRLIVAGFDPKDVELLLKWRAPEMPTEKVRTLSKADIRAAFKKGIISEAQMKEKFTAMGYLPQDVEILVSLAKMA